MADAFSDWLNSDNSSSEAQASGFTPQATSSNAFSDWLNGPDPAPALKGAIGTNADQNAKDQKLSKSSGLPIEAVKHDPAPVEAQVALNDSLHALDKAPATKDWISNPSNADVAHDDIGHLVNQENVYRPVPKEAEGGALTRGFMSAVTQGLPEDTGNAIEGLQVLTGLGEGSTIPQDLRDLAHSGTQYIRHVPSFSDIHGIGDAADYVLESLGSGVGSTIPSIISSFAGGYAAKQMGMGKLGVAVGAGTGAAIPSAAQNFGQMYGDLKAGGLDPITAAKWSIAATGPITALDVTNPVGWTMRLTGEAKREVVRGIAKRLIQEGLKSGAIEGGTEGAQQAIQLGTEAAATGKPFLTMENILSIVDNAIQGAISGTGMGTVEGLAKDRQRASVQPTEQQMIEQGQAAYVGSKLYQRDPAMAADLHSKQMREAGINELYVPATAITAAAEAANTPPVVYANQLGVAKEYMQAAVMGGDVKFAPEQYSATIATPELFPAFKDHIRLAEDGMTATEAEQFKQNAEIPTAPQYDITKDMITELQTAGFTNEQIDQMSSQDILDLTTQPEYNRPEVKGAATLAADEAGLNAMFSNAKEAGMTDKEFADYLHSIAQAQSDTLARQNEKLLKEQARTLTDQWKAEMETARDSVKESLSTDPVYQAVNNIQAERLDRDALAAVLPEAWKLLAEKQNMGEPTLTLDQLPKQDKGRNIYTDGKHEEGIDPQTWAEIHGYDSAAQMVADMIHSPNFNDAVEQAAAAKMEQDHGTLKDQQTAVQAALESIHNDSVGKVLAKEVDALRQARKDGRVKTSQVKRAARDAMQQEQVKNISASKFIAQARRLANTARIFLRKGQITNAAQAKFQQLLNFHMAQEAFAARAKIAKDLKYLKKFSKDKNVKNISDAYLIPIRTLLADYRLSGKLSLRAEKKLMAKALSDTVESNGSIINIPQQLTDPRYRVPYQEMTLDHWNTLVDTVKELEHAAVTENQSLKKEEARTRKEQVDSIIDQLDKFPESAKAVGSISKWEKAKQFGKAALVSVFNADTILRHLDGWDYGNAYQILKGGFDKAFYDGYNKDQIGLVKRRQKEAKALEEIWSTLPAKERNHLTKKFSIPGTDLTLSRNEILSVILNSGNRENIAALIESGQFTPETLKAVQDFASKEDWDFAQKTWKYLDSYWPEVKDAMLRRTGRVAPRVEGDPIQTKYGEYAGGYFPLKYDKNESAIGAAQSMEEIARQIRAGTFSSSQTQRGHMQARKNSAGNKVLLDTYALHQHVDQVVYDLELGDAISDAYHVLHNRDLVKAFRDHGMGSEHQALDLWLADQVTGEIKSSHWAEHSLRWLRTGYSISKLGWNVGTAALQPLGLTTTAIQAGKVNTLKALWHVMADTTQHNPFGKNSAWSYPATQTGFMAQREDAYNKDVTASTQQLRSGLMKKLLGGKAADFITGSMFFAMRKMQHFTDVVTWYAGLYQGMEKYDGDRERALAHADRMVARSQGSGNFSERSMWERGTLHPALRQTELVKAWTGMLSYFLAKNNVAYERLMKANYKNPLSILHLASDMALMYTFEALAGQMLYGGLSSILGKNDDDWQKFLKQSAYQTGNSIINGFPILREISGLVQGFQGSGGGIIGSQMNAFAQALLETDKHKSAQKMVKAWVNLAGGMFHFPSVQPTRTGGAIWDRMNGKHPSPEAYLLGTWVDKR